MGRAKGAGSSITDSVSHEDQNRDWAVNMCLRELVPVRMVASEGMRAWSEKHCPGMCGETTMQRYVDEAVSDICIDVAGHCEGEG